MDKFGEKVRRLREERRMTREDFCNDESQLSVRQLARIESGQSLPNLARLSFIANRLEVAISQLTDGKSYELPKRYKELKYLILRTPTYSDKTKIKLREAELDEIFENFYDDLPEEEKLISDILQSKFDVCLSNNTNFVGDILDEYFEQTLVKDVFNTNDLILIDLFLTSLAYHKKNEKLYTQKTYAMVIEKLLHQDFTTADDYFILNNVLLNNFDLAFRYEQLDTVSHVIQKSNEIMSTIQDFQKRPILSMFEWKFELHCGQLEQAQKSYDKAILFADLMGDNHLKEKLELEWQKDNNGLV